MELLNITTSMLDMTTVFPEDKDNTSHTDQMNSMNAKTGFELTIEVMNKYLLPVIILTGLVGNTTSFLVFVCTHLRHQSSSIYLAFLNMVDNMFLLSLGVGVWFGWIRVYIMHRQVLCQLIVYLTYVSSFLSVWTIVAFTIERYIVVFHPFRRHDYCTRHRAKLVVTSLSVGALVAYSFALWTTGIRVVRGNDVCMTHQRYMELMHTLTTVDTIITLAIPSVIIIAFNCAIAVKVTLFFIHRRKFLVSKYAMSRVIKSGHRSHLQPNHINMEDDGRQLRDHSRPSRTDADCNAPHFSSDEDSKGTDHEDSTGYQPVRVSNVLHWNRNSIQMRTTRALLIVSTVFVVLNLPSHVARLYALAAEFNGSKPTLKLLLWQQIFQILSYSNFSINIFLYCACSKHFRTAFKRLMSTSRRTHRVQCQCFCPRNHNI